MISTYYHICDLNNGDLTPYNRLLRREAKQPLPNFDIRGIKQAPPMLIDTFHLVESFLRLFFVHDNRNRQFKDHLLFDFWQSITNNTRCLRVLAEDARDEFNLNIFEGFRIRAVKQSFIFGTAAKVFDSGATWSFAEYGEEALYGSSVPRVSSPSKISAGYIRRGDDYRMIYKDLNEMRRFLIRLNSTVYGFDPEIHTVGNYFDKPYGSQMFVGPYIEDVESGVYSMFARVAWRNGNINVRTFPNAFTAKIAGDYQAYKNQTTNFPRTFAGDVSMYGSPRLIFVWHAHCTWYKDDEPQSRDVVAAVEIPLKTVARSLYKPVWSFDLDFSSLFDSTILPRIKSLLDFDETKRNAGIAINEIEFVLDTGITNFYHLCPDGWDYIPAD